VQTPTLLLILYEGNVHSYRQVFLDGRLHDPGVIDTWWGDSIGHWDGDALVVDTIGLNDKAWLDLLGHPRNAKAHITERFTRPELGRMNIEITIDDPGAYSKPWQVFESSQLARKGCGGTLISAKQLRRRTPFCGLLLRSSGLGNHGVRL
jgi:hypothetical protein